MLASKRVNNSLARREPISPIFFSCLMLSYDNCSTEETHDWIGKTNVVELSSYVNVI